MYFFDNFTPGKLRVLEDKPGQTEVSLKTMETYTASGQTETYTTPYNIFTPSGAQAQYAICSPIMDEYGTIYFKNDSAYADTNFIAVPHRFCRLRVLHK